MKLRLKRAVPILLALVMVLCLVPNLAIEADAATISGLTDSDIVLGGTQSKWTASTNTITGSTSGTNFGIFYSSSTETLTIQNNKAYAATLSFDYSITGNKAPDRYVTINNGSKLYVGDSGTGFEVVLAAKDSIKIVLKAERCYTSSGQNLIGIKITNLSLVADGYVTTTFQAPAYGSYSVSYTPKDATAATSVSIAAGAANQGIENHSSVTYTMTANPGSGNKFVCWKNVTTGQSLSTSTTYSAKYDSATTIQPVIVPTTTATFVVGTEYFIDLDDAVNYATANSKKQITLVDSGKISDPSYEIPAGYTLLIPRDTNYTAHGANPEFKGSVTAATEVPVPTEFRRLTLASGTTLTVNGTVEVEGMHKTMQGGNAYSNKVCGPYGAIYMEDGSNITLNGGTLYAWGYIFGSGNSATEGTVTALSGSTVYEYMQVPDFPGGSKLSGFVDTAKDADANGDGNNANDYVKAFPFSQYYIQNIEVPLTIHSGATENIYMTMTMDAKITVVDIGSVIRFVGDGGMFDSEAGGTLVKDYVPSTDRLVLTANGNASINSIELDMSDSEWAWALDLVVGTKTINSADYIFSLNGNMTINANSGSITIGQDVSMLPGVEVNVAEGAELVLRNNPNDGKLNADEGNTGGYNVYVYDLDQWGANVFQNVKLHTAQYSPTPGRYVRTAADLKDVVIDINGTVKSEGYLYTTTGGASIISSEGTGKIIMENGAGSATKAYCLNGTANESTVSVVSAMLKNGDGTYLDTAGAEAGATFTYCNTCDKWVAQEYTLNFDANAGENTVTGEMKPIKIHKGCVAKLPANAFAIEGMKLSGWNTVAAPTEEEPGVAITVEEGKEIVLKDIYESLIATLAEDATEITLYAQWETANIDVIAVGVDEEYYTVNGQKVTVTYDLACKVGFLVDGVYEAIDAEDNEDGSYSFTAEEGITEVLLVVKGDVTGDGEITNRDITMSKSVYQESRTFNAVQMFAADVTGEGELTNRDLTQIKAVYQEARSFNW